LALRLGALGWLGGDRALPRGICGHREFNFFGASAGSNFFAGSNFYARSTFEREFNY